MNAAKILESAGTCCIGSRQGRVIMPPTAAASEKKMDGVLVYNEGQAAFNCSFGAFQVHLAQHSRPAQQHILSAGTLHRSQSLTALHQYQREDQAVYSDCAIAAICCSCVCLAGCNRHIKTQSDV